MRSEPAPSRQPAPKAPSRIGAILTSGIFGGLVGAGLVYGADQFLPKPAGSASDARIAALEQRVSAGPASSGDPSGLDRRIAALEAGNRSLSEQVAASRGAPAETRPATPDPALQSALDALAARVSAAEEAGRQGNAARDALGQSVGEVRRDLAQVKTGLADQAKQSGAAAETNAAALTEIGARLSALQSQAAGQAAAATAAVGAMQARLGDDEKRLAEMADAFARFGPAAAQAGLRVIVASRVGEALRDGQPLGGLLTTLQRIGAPADVVAPLQPYGGSAPASPAALAREFDPLARRTIDASRGPASSIGDRLLRMADRIVTVRDVGDTSGTDIAAQVQRVETALARGMLSEAATAWDALPDASKAISAEWATRLKQRAGAAEAARRLSSDALSAIDASMR